MSSERAGTPKHGDADADAAWQAYRAAEWQGWDHLHADLREAFLAGWVARPVRRVVPDPHIARIEALVSPLNRLYNFPVPAEELRAILRGDQ